MRENALSYSQSNPTANKVRNSNLELYRIICMLMIVAHHFVVNSDLVMDGAPLVSEPDNIKSIFLSLFGAWGKTGINCFLMITGYFMCTSPITVRKFLKLILQIYFYKWAIFFIFLLTGYEAITLQRIAKLVMPVWGFSDNFTSCFIVFWLTIPYLSIVVNHMTKRQHQLLLLLLLGCYTLLGSIPSFNITFNYITWFGVLFFFASYIRLHPHPVFEKKGVWGWLTFINILLAIGSIVAIELLLDESKGFGLRYFFVSDCNKFFAMGVATCSFLWFKNLDIKQNRVINAFGAATFGVLLIHANSNAMRQWLWKDTVDIVGHYSLPVGQLVLYSIGVVLIIFVVCNLIDQLRIHVLEKPFFRWYDKYLDNKIQSLIRTQ